MKNNLYHGYKPEQIFENEEEERRVLSWNDVKREEFIGDRVMKLKEKEERKKLLNQDENKNKNNETKKTKSYYTGQGSESEESKEKKERKSKSKRKKTVDSEGEELSLSIEDEDDKQIKKEPTDIKLEDMKSIVLSRNFFEKYYYYPNFDEKVKGAFIRVNLSSTRELTQNNYTGYSIGEIEKIITKDRMYDFAGNKCTKYIKLKNLTEIINFLVISNSPIIEEELNKLKGVDKSGLPTPDQITKIKNNLDEIKKKQLTSEELHNILTQKKKDRIKYKDATLNVTEELDRALEQYRAKKEQLKEMNDSLEDEEKEKLIKEIKELEDDINQLEKMKEERERKAKFYSENDIVAKINEDIKEKRKMDERMSLLAKKRKNEINDKEHKLFKRVDCHPSNLFDNGVSQNDSLKLIKKETSEVIENKNRKKKKHEKNFSYAKKIRQFKEFISSKQNLIDEMMENEKKKNEVKESNDNKNEIKEENNNDDQNNSNIDKSMFFKLASINYDIYNKMIKDQNKQNTKDPEIKILKFDEYLSEHNM